MATRTNVNKAAPYQQFGTVTIADTWADGDSATLTVDGQSVTVTIDSTDVTPAGVAQRFAAAINAASRIDGIVGGETRNIGGQEIPQVRELTATWTSGATFELAMDTGGRVSASSITVTETTAGTGTATYSEDQAGTGKTFWNDADNWDGAVPVTNDLAVFRDNAVSFTDGFPASGLGPLNMKFHQSWTGQLGRALVNTDTTNFHYQESRATELFIDGITNSEIDVGEGIGSGSSRIRLRFASSSEFSARIHNTGTAPSASERAVTIIGESLADTNQAVVYKGSVEFDTCGFDQLRIGFSSAKATDSNVLFKGCRMATDGFLIVAGGMVDFDCDWSSTGILTVNDGTLIMRQGVPTLEINGGTVISRNITGLVNTITQLNGFAGTLDFSGETEPVTITNATFRPGFTLLDPNGIVSFTNAPIFDNTGFKTA